MKNQDLMLTNTYHNHKHKKKIKKNITRALSQMGNVKIHQ